MRGKYITTMIKLAVLAGNKKNKVQVEETKATIEDYKTLWTKELFGAKQSLVNSATVSKAEMAEAI
jgi:hypothetical protein